MRIIFALTLLLSLSVSQAQEKTITIGLIGDSTVAEQSGWGPAFAERFDRRATILNYAKNGATLESLSAKLDELVQHQPDYVLIQFGHNDQKRYDTTVYRIASSPTSSASSRPEASRSSSSVTRRSFDADEDRVQPGQKREIQLRHPTDYANAAEAVARN